jgi:hypothetical protein
MLAMSKVEQNKKLKNKKWHVRHVKQRTGKKYIKNGMFS